MVTQNVAAVDINKCLKPGFLIRFWPKKPDLVPGWFSGSRTSSKDQGSDTKSMKTKRKLLKHRIRFFWPKSNPYHWQKYSAGEKIGAPVAFIFDPYAERGGVGSNNFFLTVKSKNSPTGCKPV